MSTKKDIKNCAMYAANGIIVDLFDFGITPTVEALRNNWQSDAYKHLTDEELNDIIERVSHYYK